MQLVAYGAQDIYLTGNPMITFFKVVYRRHTNFAMESILQTFSGTADFNQQATAIVSRNGDLISGAYLKFTLPSSVTTGTAADRIRWIDCLGHYLVKEVSVDIGGQLIDRQYSDWLEIWAQLTVPASHAGGYYEMIGQDPGFQGLRITKSGTSGVNQGADTNSSGQRVLHVPLQFWFCRNVGLALPLIALQYHEVRITVTFEASSNVIIAVDQLNADVTPTITGSLGVQLWIDYIFLDTDERRRFAQVSHEYLIEQVQRNTSSYSTTSNNVTLNFNHPVKELIWVCRDGGSNTRKMWNNYTTRVNLNDIISNPAGGVITARPHPLDPAADDGLVTANDNELARNLTQSARLRLNGHDRFAEREGSYFNKVQTGQHHTRTPISPGINVYSFALQPEDHQPSGTCNFSRIDNARLELTLRDSTVAVAGAAGDATGSGITMVFALNYNVLRIMSGMGGLAYSN